MSYVRSATSDRPPLQDIATLCGTDKAKHGTHIPHTSIYESYLSRLRGHNIKLLEIGVLDGSSLKMWKRYFPCGEVYAIDIDERCKQLEEERIHVSIGDQSDTNFLRNCFPDVDVFDIVIDDGSHVNKHIATSFEELFPKRLKNGGIYFIEDLGCSYKETWPYWSDDESLKNRRHDMDLFFTQLISDLDHCRKSVLGVHFWEEMCVIQKASSVMSVDIGSE